MDWIISYFGFFREPAYILPEALSWAIRSGNPEFALWIVSHPSFTYGLVQHRSASRLDLDYLKLYTIASKRGSEQAEALRHWIVKYCENHRPENCTYTPCPLYQSADSRETKHKSDIFLESFKYAVETRQREKVSFFLDAMSGSLDTYDIQCSRVLRNVVRVLVQSRDLEFQKIGLDLLSLEFIRSDPKLSKLLLHDAMSGSVPLHIILPWAEPFLRDTDFLKESLSISIRLPTSESTEFWHQKLKELGVDHVPRNLLTHGSPAALRYFSRETYQLFERLSESERETLLREAIEGSNTDNFAFFVKEFQLNVPRLRPFWGKCSDETLDLLVDSVTPETQYIEHLLTNLIKHNDLPRIMKLTSKFGRFHKKPFRKAWGRAAMLGNLGVMHYIERNVGCICKYRDFFEVLHSALTQASLSSAKVITNRLRTLQPKRFAQSAAAFVCHFLPSTAFRKESYSEVFEWLMENDFPFTSECYMYLLRHCKGLRSRRGLPNETIFPRYYLIFSWLAMNKVPLPSDPSQRSELIAWLKTDSEYENDVAMRKYIEDEDTKA